MEKIVNLRDKIINKQTGVYYEPIENLENLTKEINEAHKENLFSKHKISYVYTYDGMKITMVLHKTFPFIEGDKWQ